MLCSCISVSHGPMFYPSEPFLEQLRQSEWLDRRRSYWPHRATSAAIIAFLAPAFRRLAVTVVKRFVHFTSALHLYHVGPGAAIAAPVAACLAPIDQNQREFQTLRCAHQARQERDPVAASEVDPRRFSLFCGSCTFPNQSFWMIGGVSASYTTILDVSSPT